jgi:hypothetical protein
MPEHVFNWMWDELHGFDACLFALAVLCSFGIWFWLGSPKSQRKKNGRRVALTLVPAALSKREQAIRLLKEGIRKGLVSEQIRSGFPQNVWAVTEDGIALEAQLENAGSGTYHGYPLPEDDPFREKVIEKWKATS